jgi:hypothetical protein
MYGAFFGLVIHSRDYGIARISKGILVLVMVNLKFFGEIDELEKINENFDIQT